MHWSMVYKITIIDFLIQLIFLWNRIYYLFQDKLSFSTENFIRSENNLALLWLYVLLC